MNGNVDRKMPPDKLRFGTSSKWMEFQFWANDPFKADSQKQQDVEKQDQCMK